MYHDKWWAVVGRGKRGGVYGLFKSKWKSERALQLLWNIRDAQIIRVKVNVDLDKTCFEIISHEYKYL